MIKIMKDVWVNWSQEEGKNHYVPEYFEWDPEDKVGLADHIPVVKVKPDLYDYLLECRGKLPDSLVEPLKGTAFLRSTAKAGPRMVNYALIVTDGERVIALLARSNRAPLYKSKLTPRQDLAVIDLMSPYDYQEVEWRDVRRRKDKDTENPLDKMVEIKPEYMLGLTRKERKLKEILLDCLFDLACSLDKRRIHYWYIELFPKMYRDPSLDAKDNLDMLEEMFNTLKVGWSDRHNEFGNNLVKHSEVFREVWEQIQNEEKDKQKEK